MIIIPVYNAKGGVGKTTSVVNISAVLADMGYRVLCIDADLQGNATMTLLPDVEVKKNIKDVLLYGENINNVAVDTPFPNISICPCIREPVKESSVSIDDFIHREETLKEALKQLENPPDFVLIDCPPALNAFTENALAAATHVIVPYKNDLYALEGIDEIIEECRRIQSLYNPNLNFLGVFFTHDSNRRVNKQIKDLLEETLGNRFFETTIRDSTIIPQSTFEQKPAYIYKKYAEISFDYKRLVRELLDKIGPLQKEYENGV